MALQVSSHGIIHEANIFQTYYGLLPISRQKTSVYFLNNSRLESAIKYGFASFRVFNYSIMKLRS